MAKLCIDSRYKNEVSVRNLKNDTKVYVSILINKCNFNAYDYIIYHLKRLKKIN